MMETASILQEICSHLEEGDHATSRNLLIEKYPFQPIQGASRSYTKTQMLKVFMRDGFIDRYSGNQLVFPPVLRILSQVFPKEFPYHPHWKMDECHIAYWNLLPTLDHIVPVSRGGEDTEANWVCTSQMRNSVKGGWLLEELFWELHPAGCSDEWDGLLDWAVTYCDNNPELLKNGYVADWMKAYYNLNSYVQTKG